MSVFVTSIVIGSLLILALFVFLCFSCDDRFSFVWFVIFMISFFLFVLGFFFFFFFMYDRPDETFFVVNFRFCSDVLPDLCCFSYQTLFMIYQVMKGQESVGTCVNFATGSSNLF